eukprot:g2896.t1
MMRSSAGTDGRYFTISDECFLGHADMGLDEESSIHFVTVLRNNLPIYSGNVRLWHTNSAEPDDDWRSRGEKESGATTGDWQDRDMMVFAIRPLSAWANTKEECSNRAVENLIDGQLDYGVNGKYDWLTACNQKQDAYAIIDFGTGADGPNNRISYFLVWNQNEYDDSRREVKDLAISYSDDGVEWTTTTVCTLDRSDRARPQPPSTCSVPGSLSQSFRYWKFAMLDFYGSDCRAGLMEIQAYRVLGNRGTTPCPAGYHQPAAGSKDCMSCGIELNGDRRLLSMTTITGGLRSDIQAWRQGQVHGQGDGLSSESMDTAQPSQSRSIVQDMQRRAMASVDKVEDSLTLRRKGPEPTPHPTRLPTPHPTFPTDLISTFTNGTDTFEDNDMNGWSCGSVTTCGSYGAICGGYNVKGTGATISKEFRVGTATPYSLTLDFLAIDSWDNEWAYVKVDAGTDGRYFTISDECFLGHADMGLDEESSIHFVTVLRNNLPIYSGNVRLWHTNSAEPDDDWRSRGEKESGATTGDWQDRDMMVFAIRPLSAWANTKEECSNRAVENLIDGQLDYGVNGKYDWLTACNQKQDAYAIIDFGTGADGPNNRISYFLVWNQNEYDDSRREVKDLAISYSDDGVEWTTTTVCTLDRSDRARPQPPSTCSVPGSLSQSFRYWKFAMLDFYGSDCRAGLMEIQAY